MSDVCCPDDDEPQPEKAKRPRPSFSHGRRNTVVVEVKRRRILAPSPDREGI